MTSAVRAARRSGLEDMATRARLPAGEGEKVDDQLPVPDSLPAIRSLMWDRADNLWVGVLAA